MPRNDGWYGDIPYCLFCQEGHYCPYHGNAYYQIWKDHKEKEHAERESIRTPEAEAGTPAQQPDSPAGSDHEGDHSPGIPGSGASILGVRTGGSGGEASAEGEGIPAGKPEPAQAVSMIGAFKYQQVYSRPVSLLDLMDFESTVNAMLNSGPDFYGSDEVKIQFINGSTGTTYITAEYDYLPEKSNKPNDPAKAVIT